MPHPQAPLIWTAINGSLFDRHRSHVRIQSALEWDRHSIRQLLTTLSPEPLGQPALLGSPTNSHARCFGGVENARLLCFDPDIRLRLCTEDVKLHKVVDDLSQERFEGAEFRFFDGLEEWISWRMYQMNGTILP